MLEKPIYEKCESSLGHPWWCTKHDCWMSYCERLKHITEALIDLDQRQTPHKVKP